MKKLVLLSLLLAPCSLLLSQVPRVTSTQTISDKLVLPAKADPVSPTALELWISTTDANTVKYRSGGTTFSLLTSTGGAALVSDTAYDATSWNGVTGIAPSKNAVRDIVEQLQPLNSNLTSWAGITRASGFDTFTATPTGTNLAGVLTSALPASKGGTGLTSLSANVVSLLGAADYSTMRTQLSLVPGTDVQVYDADLDDLADGSLTGSKVGTGISATNVNTGTLPTAQLPALSGGDVTSSAGSAVLTIAADAVALTSDTTGDYVATVTGDSEITVSGSGTEGRAVTLAIGSTLARDAEVAAAYQPLDSDLTSWSGVTRASGLDTFTGTPTSANLRGLLTDETGSGAAVFGTGPSLSNVTLSGTTTFGTGLSVASGVSEGSNPALNVNLDSASTNTAFLNLGGTNNISRVLAWREGTSNDRLWSIYAFETTGGSDSGELRLEAYDDTNTTVDFPLVFNRFAGGSIDVRRPLLISLAGLKIRDDVLSFSTGAGAGSTWLGDSALSGRGYFNQRDGQSGFYSYSAGSGLSVGFEALVAGTSIASKTAAPSGMSARFRLGSWGGSTWVRGIAEMQIETVSTQSESNRESRIKFYTTANAATSSTERMSIASDGTVAIASTTEATTAGAGALTAAGGIRSAKKLMGAGLHIGLTNGTSADLITSATATLDFGSISAAASADLTITVTGATTGDTVHLGLPSSPEAGIIFNAYVSASNTVTVRAFNFTASPVDPVSASYRAVVTSF